MMLTMTILVSAIIGSVMLEEAPRSPVVIAVHALPGDGRAWSPDPAAQLAFQFSLQPFHVGSAWF